MVSDLPDRGVASGSRTPSSTCGRECWGDSEREEKEREKQRENDNETGERLRRDV